MRTFTVIYFIIISNIIFSQSNEKFADHEPCNFRIDASFSLGYGYGWFNKINSLPSSADLLLNNSNHGFTFLTLPDIQFILKDKLGLSTGFDFINGSTNDKKIIKEFQNTEPYYYTQIPSDEYNRSYSSLAGKYNFKFFKLGLIGFNRISKKLVLIPSINWLFNLESTYPEFQIKYKEPNSNYMFTRSFTSNNVKVNGLKIGLNSRIYYYFDKPKKHVSSYIEAKIELIYLQSKASFFYEDTDIYSKASVSTPISITNNFLFLNVGISFLGIDLKWKKKKDVSIE